MKIAVSAYVGFGNFGDEAIFYALSQHLKTKKHDIELFCANPKEISLKYGVKACYYKSFFEIIKTLFHCDILISGGGSLLQNKTSKFSLYYYLFIIFLAKLFFKKTIIFSQGFEGVKGKFSNFLTKTILKTVDLITVRDEKSINELKKYNINNAILTSDPVYSLTEEIPSSQNKEGILVQLRSYFDIKENFISDLAFAFYQNNIKEISIFSFQQNYDREICLNFQNELKKYNIESKLIENKNIKETIDILNNAKYVISTRLHGILCAQALKTNTFGFIYDDKIQTLCEELEIESLDIRNYSKEDLIKKIGNFLNKEQIFKNHRKYNWETLDNFIGAISD